MDCVYDGECRFVKTSLSVAIKMENLRIVKKKKQKQKKNAMEKKYRQQWQQ